MPKRRHAYPLKEGGPKRVVVTWEGDWRNIEVRLDDQVVGTIPDYDAFVDGRSFKLPDGSVLHVEMDKLIGVERPRVTHEGDVLPGSDDSPTQQIKVSAWASYTIAAFYIVFGLLDMVIAAPWLASLGVDAVSLLFGAAFIVLGFLIARESLWAVAGALALLSIETSWAFMDQLTDNQSRLAGLAIRCALAVPLVLGFGAWRALRDEERRPDPQTAMG